MAENSRAPMAFVLRLERSIRRAKRLPLASPDTESQSVLDTLDSLIYELEERLELLRLPEQPTIEEEAVEVKVVPEEVWTREHDLLYEDILFLFKLGDREGALVSLGRLMDIASETNELAKFLQINRQRLLQLYESIIGPPHTKLTLVRDNLGNAFFWNRKEAELVLSLLKKFETVGEVVANSPLDELKTLSLLRRFLQEEIVAKQAITATSVGT